jgi:hypothetical protein
MCLAPAFPAARGLYYSFSNVSRGVPRQSCYLALVGLSKSLGGTIGGVGIGVACFFLVNQVLICVVCCTRRKQDEEALAEKSRYEYELPVTA